MLKHFQKKLRASQTQAESLLWSRLRTRQFYGFKFKRQQILQRYIVDFVCFEKKFVIELDGGQHSWQKPYDDFRTLQIEKDGFYLMRFWNHEVLTNIEGVLAVIHMKLMEL